MFNQASHTYTKPIFWGGSGYRFTFNGKENDIETQTQDYGMRIYDGRLGRFLSVDPLAKEFIDLAPYQFTENSPIANVDLDGLERYYTANGILIGTIGNSTEIRLTNSKNTSSVAYWVRAANNPPKNTDANFGTRAAKYANTMSVPTFVIPTAKLETQPKTTSSSGNGKPWYDLEGSDNGGNDRVAPGGPDAAGMGFGCEGSFPGFQAGVSENRLETENGYRNFTTIKVGAENSIAFKASYGPTLDLYWKTDAGKNKPVSELILGTSNYMSAGAGIMFTYSWTENDEGKTTMRGLSFSLGAGAASGKQYTFESIGKPKAKE